MRSPEKASISFGGLVPFVRHWPPLAVCFGYDMIPAARWAEVKRSRSPQVFSDWLITLWLCQQFAIENGPFMVDLPIKNGDFP